MIMDELIIGAGGGGGKGGGSKGEGYTPSEDKDTLESTAYAYVLDLIGEGEIEGFATPSSLGITRGTSLYNTILKKDIFFNDTSLLREQASNSDATPAASSFNFKRASVYARYGTENQSTINVFPNVQREFAVGVEIVKNLPLTRTITDEDVNKVGITLTIPLLQRFTDKGDLVGSELSFRVLLSEDGGAFYEAYKRTIKGLTKDPFPFNFAISLTGKTFPVDVRVERVSNDSSSSRESSSLQWTSYTEIITDRLRYPYSALVGIKISAEQFNSIPTRSYRIRGRKIQLPSNATVDIKTGRVTYAGIWNGAFGAAQWCADPAWCLFDLLRNSRMGFGEHIQTADLDKWSFYEASKYCNELVPTGLGSAKEPRFQCNVVIQTQEEAYNLINQMCSVFRAMPYWSTGSLTISQDRPQDATFLFTMANVTEAGFSYSGSDTKTRPTAVTVKYFDTKTTRDVAYELVEDADLIEKYGYNNSQIDAFACTSQSQARRVGKWVLYTSQYETEIVTFSTSIDAGTICRPGQIIEISDPMRAGVRRGGRIASATTTVVTVDDSASTDIPTTNSPTLSVVMPDGTLETRTITGVAGAAITVSPAFSQTPATNSVWIAQSTDIQTSTWRVLGVSEQEGGVYSVTALSYNASKYALIERDEPLESKDTTNLNVLYDGPDNLTATEVFYGDDGVAKVKIVLSWVAIVGITTYRVRYRYANDNWTEDLITKVGYEIIDTRVGTYNVEVYALNSALLPGNPSILTFSASGKTAPPAAVTGVSFIPISADRGTISWTQSTELDVTLGGRVIIRHNVALVGAEWDASTDIISPVDGADISAEVPLLEGTYLLKFEDDLGNRSFTATTVVVDLPEPQPRINVTTFNEDTTTPPFDGNSTDMVYSLELDGLILASGIDIDDMALDGDFDALTAIDAEGGVVDVGEYEFGSSFDMLGKYDVMASRRLVTRPYLPASLWDDRTAEIDTWPLIDEDNLDKVNAALYVRTTNDDPSGTPTWSEWKQLVNGLIQGRGFQFKVQATTSDPDLNIIIEELGASLELTAHTEQSGTIASGAGTYTATFANAFYQAPNIGITAFNMATGDYYTISNVTRTGFQVVFRNSANAAVDRNFTYTAVGYGRELP